MVQTPTGSGCIQCNTSGAVVVLLLFFSCTLGWAWLVQSSAGELKVVDTHDAGCPLTEGLTPLLACDVWEHAYYIGSLLFVSLSPSLYLYLHIQLKLKLYLQSQTQAMTAQPSSSLSTIARLTS